MSALSPIRNARSIFLIPLGAATLMLAMSTAAVAGFVETGGGDSAVVPYYQTYVLGGIGKDGNFAFGSSEASLYMYKSNVAPYVNNFLQTNVSHSGASFHGIGQSVYSGFYAGRNYAEMTVNNARDSAVYYQVAGGGTATSVRFFDASAAAARAVFTWRVTGTESGTVGRTDGRLDFGASTNPDVNWNHLFDDPGNLLDSFTNFGPGTYTYSLPVVDLGTTINLFYWSSAFVQVEPGNVADGSSFSLSANYSNTYYLDTVELLDSSDVPLTGWTLKDLTANVDVFTDAGRITPFAPAPPLSSPVPEPGTSTLLLTGLAALVFIRRRVKSSAGPRSS